MTCTERRKLATVRPDEWRAAVVRWRGMNAAHQVRLPALELPDPPTDYFIYQSLIGGWPVGDLAADPTFRDRFKAYMAKATAEAKVHTSWINPDASYERAIEGYLDAILDPERSAAFLADVGRFVASIRLPGFLNSLTQVLLKVAGPGVPDVYQGTEVWDFTYADPDNRRPVDFEHRIALLGRIKAEVATGGAAAAARMFLSEVESGAIKAFVLTQALGLRRSRPAAFESPRYEACAVHGALARHVVAFSRGEPGRRIIAVGGRFYARLTGGGVSGALGEAWGDAAVQLDAPLPNARYRDALTDRPLSLESIGSGSGFRLRNLFDCLPVALLEEIS